MLQTLAKSLSAATGIAISVFLDASKCHLGITGKAEPDGEEH